MKKFLSHLARKGVGILSRRALDWVAAANVTLSTNGFGTIDPGEAAQVFTITGNIAADLAVSGVLFIASRYFSYKADQ